MSDQLKVDLGKLHDLSITLGRLHNDLDEIPNRIDDYPTDMGHPGLADATRTIGEDWDSFRRNLISDLSTLGTFAERAQNAYKDADANLADLIHGLMDPPKHGRARAD